MHECGGAKHAMSFPVLARPGIPFTLAAVPTSEHEMKTIIQGPLFQSCATAISGWIAVGVPGQTGAGQAARGRKAFLMEYGTLAYPCRFNRFRLSSNIAESQAYSDSVYGLPGAGYDVDVQPTGQR